jgi:16S rRNA (cytidine1402-2'-O)-methyltransferase
VLAAATARVPERAAVRRLRAEGAIRTMGRDPRTQPRRESLRAAVEYCVRAALWQASLEGSVAVTAGEEKSAIGPALYVVATPLGNLRDITLRALDVLASVDVIAAEDTRVTAKLLARHRIAARLLSVHEHNERRRAAEVLALLAAGKSVALVSDAGTPAVSDPGAALVRAATDAGYTVVPVPGPSAVVAALSSSGIVAPQWLFCGFLPTTAPARRAALERVRDVPAALVFFEAPHRIVAAIEALAAALDPQREIVIARELTKRFETIHRCRLSQAAPWLAADPDRVRGEFVLVVAPPGAVVNDGDDIAAADRTLGILLAELPLAQAVRLAVKLTGAPRNRLYQRALTLAKGERD